MIDLRDLETSFCPCCHGHGFIPEGDEDRVRYERCADCGGTGYFKAVA